MRASLGSVWMTALSIYPIRIHTHSKSALAPYRRMHHVFITHLIVDTKAQKYGFELTTGKVEVVAGVDPIELRSHCYKGRKR